MNMWMESSLGDMLLKVGLFIVVQALVYLILSKSSNIFSKTQLSSPSFRRSPSVCVRRIAAALADMPSAASPSPKDVTSPSRKDRTAHDHSS